MSNTYQVLHKPVLLNEIIKSLSEMDRVTSILDATFGRGGHLVAIHNAFRKAKIVAIDRDLEAIQFAKDNVSKLFNLDSIEIHHMNFSRAYTLKKTFDAIIVDLGVCSSQLESAHRGFSFRLDGPLDMRMNTEEKLLASHLVNNLNYKQLCELFIKYGQVTRPQKVVNAIIHHRKNKKIDSTLELANIITTQNKKTKMHPATNYFMALRIKVNNELDSLSESLDSLIDQLLPGGRLMVISFHSLEDRIIKFNFKNSRVGKQLNKKVIKPSQDEIKDNPRSRSAKLRIFIKGPSF